MIKVYLGCCFFLYQEKLVLWSQLSEKKAQTQTSVRVRCALLALLVSSLGFFPTCKCAVLTQVWC